MIKKLMMTFLCLAAVNAFAAMTNVWECQGSKSVRFEVKLLDPKAQVRVYRKCIQKKPRLRMDSGITILPFCFRSGIWNAEVGRSEWNGAQLNYGVFGCGKALATNVWHTARFIARDNASSLQVKIDGVWREVGFCEHRWGTTVTGIETMLTKDGRRTALVRNIKAVDSPGKARILKASTDGMDVVAEFTTGPARSLIRLSFADGAPEQWMYICPQSQNYYCTRYENRKEVWYERTCRDCMLHISTPNLKIYTQPYIKAFRPKERAAAIDYADGHPETAASATSVKFRFGADGTVWLNDFYQGEISNKISRVWLYVSELSPKLPKLSRVAPRVLSASEMVLDPSEQLGAKKSTDGRSYLKIFDHTEHSDPGQETDHYFERGPFGGLKDSFVWTVPAGCWAKAKVVAGIDPDAPASNTVPIVTVRLARNDFAGYGNAAATGRIDLVKSPRRKVGTAEVGGKKIDLYEYETFLSVGDIQDRIYMKYGKTPFGKKPMLHAEVVGPLGRPGILWDKSQKPDWRFKSSALVFGFKLYESPCEMELMQSQSGLIFGDDEKRATTVRLKANVAGNYVINATIGDWWGKTVKTFSIPVALSGGEEKKMPISLQMDDEGWYSLELKLTGKDTRIVHRASFADMGRDTRKAGYESPFSFWWYGSYHGSTNDMNIWGPILKKMGIRRINEGDGSQTEATMKKYGITLSQIPFNIPLAMSQKPLAQKVTEYEAWLRKLLEDFPSVERRALIFHESYCGGDSRYLFGLPYKQLPESAFAEAKKRYELGVALCRMIREKFPDIKIQLGNSSTSYDIMDMMFRLKFPAELFDYLGSETVARFTMPDIPSANSAPNSLWYLNRVADYYGYRQRANICYEWASHLPRELGPYDSVVWALRDKLLGFANGGTMTPLGGATPDDSYYNSDYGGIGSVERYPYLYPTRGYVAAGVLTKELDLATFSRKVETGSQSVTALEFKRKNGECVYALWLPRGVAELKAVGAEARRIVRADAKRLERLLISPLPIFATYSKAVESFEIVARETSGAVKPKNFELADALESASSVSFVNLEGRPEANYFTEKKHKVPGRFTIKDGGGCVLVERDPSGPAPAKLVPEFGYFELKNPVTLKGEKQTLSVEVDGNSSWAEIMFVIEDAEGKRHYPTGIAYEGDGKAWSRVNFDGWGTMQIPFGKKSRVRSSEVVPGGDHWRCDRRGKKNSDVVYPVKIIGFGLLMPRDTLTGGRWEELKRNPNVLRLRNLGMFE